MHLNAVIIDDEIEINQGLSKYISESDNDFKVIATFTDGKKALDFVKKNQVDVVITDINMPDISGIDIIRTLYAEDKDIDIMIISAHREFEYAMEALKYNVHRYITKPIDFEELSDSLNEIKLKRSKKNAEIYDSDPYIICKTLVDIYNNTITIKKARSIFEYLSFDADNCNYTNVSVKFSNLTIYLETQWNYGKGQFYDAVSNILNDAETLSGRTLDKFYFLAPNGESLEFVYVGNNIEKNSSAKLTALIKENLNLKAEFFIDSTVTGLEAFSNQYNREEASADNSQNEDFIIQKAKAIIEQNYMNDISLYDVASSVCLNYVYFSKFFKQCTGVNFIDYIIDLRLNKAVELLKERKYTISEISSMVGYQSHTYFLRLFKSHLGCSPKEFVRRYLTDDTE